LEDQEAPFGFEVKIFTFEESQKLIRTLRKDYYEGVVSLDKELLDDGDTVDLAKPARDAFLALFSDLPEFENESIMDGFLGQADSINDAKIVPRLLSWAKERHQKLEQLVAQQPLLANAENDLRGLMEPFLKTAVLPHHEGYEDLELECSGWPFVKSGVYEPIHRLLTELADNIKCYVER
jgi:hypothetical protein